MPSLKDLRNRRDSVKATRKITKAMQMVAAAKLRRAQDAATAARPYAERMDRVLANLNQRANRAGASPLLVGTGKDEVHLLIVMTAERGLCGGFNSNIVRLARADALRLRRDGKTVKILCVGRKGYDMLRRDWGRQIVDRVDLKGVKNVAFANAADIAQKVRAMFDAGEFDVATQYFSEFKSVIAQKPTAQQLIPVKLPSSTGVGGAKSEAVYEYEPEEGEILSYLLPRNIAAQIFRGLLENAASEQGARMSAMDSATRNAGEMIDKLNLRYNRLRQANITKELIEIISGAGGSVMLGAVRTPARSAAQFSEEFLMGETSYTSDFFLSQQAGSASSSEVVVPLVLKHFPVKSVVDVGCGVGGWLKTFEVCGVNDYLGLDGDYVPRETLKIPRSKFQAVDLAKPRTPERRFDLACSLEVAEHLPRESAERFISYLVQLAPVILFSAAIPAQGGTNHVNEQWQSYWARLFKKHGYAGIDCIRPEIYYDERVKWWYRQNILVFCEAEKIPLRLNAVATDYDFDRIHPEMVANLLAKPESGKAAAGALVRVVARKIGYRV